MEMRTEDGGGRLVWSFVRITISGTAGATRVLVSTRVDEHKRNRISCRPGKRSKRVEPAEGINRLLVIVGSNGPVEVSKIADERQSPT